MAEESFKPKIVDDVMDNINGQIRTISPMRKRNEGGQIITNPVRRVTINDPSRSDEFEHPANRSKTPRMLPLRNEQDHYLHVAEKELEKWKSQTPQNDDNQKKPVKPIVVSLDELEN